MASSEQPQSQEQISQWMQNVHDAHSKRSPQAVEEARQRAEQARTMEQQYRKCKAVKSHAFRSRALAAETMNQMANSAGVEQLEIQQKWQSAQEVSRERSMASYMSYSAMPTAPSHDAAPEPAAILPDADEEEDEAMTEVADLMGAADRAAMSFAGQEGLTDVAGAPTVGRPGAGSKSRVQELMETLRWEPEDESEQAAKFMLFEGYSKEVEDMRETLFKFHVESRPTVPDAVGSDMDRQLTEIDSQEAMGIPDDVREWIVYHMMRQAERNNLTMAGILEGFEKKLAFLAGNDQSECPVCLDPFASEGPHVAQTLGCCHKVCKECWGHWCVATHSRPFCPLCKNDEFLGTVARRMSGAARALRSDED
mmetsp:Transcript_60174/g.196584  ORF Transcript_60174/g.196584 Transcript_60174/m.196584 type:complete len:367 (+) Transcript_60174:84-1184(+)|eukprot:CAMPEP_0203901146 /NCGR_PEP_ID=MMETSP0359-20131031/43350_1 /ASSEMBLY_ACC=CAM_ASM_000338 /TAXON_ID=268821 /ORGANISM="Scrippsiella Hangoei, Strain SHTV-5" /LENGTH=366 /DNA_ID=CAMNT_0050824759 /DNA_START=54 /DNA_END=1154 /DNA_ORIENTATION=-